MSGHPGYKLLLDEMWDLHCLKASHYGTAEDPLANLRQSADIGIEAWRACVGEAKNAFFRVTNHCKNGHLPESSMIDALKDVAAFSMLAVVFLREIEGDDEEDPEAWKEALKEQIEFRQWKEEQQKKRAAVLERWVKSRQSGEIAHGMSGTAETWGPIMGIPVEEQVTGYRPPSEEIGNKMTEVLEKAK